MAAIHMRMLAYSVSLVLHSVSLFLLNSVLSGPVMEDPDIRTFTALYRRFFTVWTVTLHIIVNMMGLSSDYLTLKYSDSKQPPLLVILREAKDRIFAAVLFPTVFLTATMFWSLYYYDRGLICPLFADKILNQFSNHVMHTVIVPLMFWEVVFQPRTVPKSHRINLTILTVYMVTYLIVMCYTFFDSGVWMYPVFGLAYDIHVSCFSLSIAAIGVALFVYYHMQWIVTQIVWGSSKIKTKVSE